MKIYISGTEDPNKRKQVKEILEENGHEVVDGQAAEKQSWILSKRGKNAVRISLIPHCDIIFLMDGWEKSSIARREFNKAVEEKLTICFEGDENVKKRKQKAHFIPPRFTFNENEYVVLKRKKVEQ